MAGPRSYRRSALALSAALLTSLALGFLIIHFYRSDDERGLLAELISSALSTPTSTVSIGAIEGALSSDATISDLKIGDRDGVWLTVDRIRIVWKRMALLKRRLEIDHLDVNEVRMARKPLPAEGGPARERRSLFPELPLLVNIKQFSLARLDFGEPVLGDAASFSTGGSAKIGPPADGLALFLDAQRLDKPATLNVRVNFVPKGQLLGVSVKLDEPAGGILSRLGNIAGRPPLKLDIGGVGPLDAFTATLAFDAGDAARAEGQASVNREGAGRRLAANVSGDIAGLLPQVAAPVFAGTSKISGDVLFGDDSDVAINKLALEAAVARLDVTGAISAARVADISVSMKNTANAGNRTAVKEAEISHLALDAHIVGALDSPAIESTLDIEDARLPEIGLERLTARFNATPKSALSSAEALLDFSADGSAAGLSFSDPALAQAIGASADFEMRGVGALKGVVDFQTLMVRTQAASAAFKGRGGPKELNGHLDLAAPDLARLSKLTGLALKGDARLGCDLEGEPTANRIGGKIDARVTGFASGVAPIDGLVGGRLTLTGAATLDGKDGFSFQNLQVTGANASARVDGAATAEKSDVTASIDAPDLSKADARAAGRGEFIGHLTGPLAHPNARAQLSIRQGALLGRPVRLDLVGEAADLTGALDANVNLNGEIDRKPAYGSLHVARTKAGGVALDGIDLRIGSMLAQGGVALEARKLATGQFTVRADDLDDLSPLLLHKVSGTLDAKATLSGVDGRQNAALQANVKRLEGLGARIDRLTADLAVTDVYESPSIAGDLAVDEAHIGGEIFSSIRLSAKGGREASDMTLTAAGRGLNFNGRARLVAASPPRLEVASFDVARGGNKVGLAGPATLTFKDNGVDLGAMAINIGGGRLTLEGRAGSKLDLKAAVRAIPLSAAELASPGLGLSGRLDGEATLGGAAAAPTGAYSVKIAGLTAPQTTKAGLPPVDVDAKGRLDGKRTALEAVVALGQAGSLRIAGNAALSASGPIDLAVKGAVDAGLANRSLSASGRGLAGSLALDVRVTGAPQRPQASGSIAFSNGSFQDATQGVRLNDVTARLVARNDAIVIESASAKTPNGGSITAAGAIRIDPDGAFPADIRIKAQDAQLTHNALQTTVADLDLAVSGPLGRLPRVAGRIGIDSLDITIPDRLPSSLRPLPGTRHIDPTPSASARLALAASNKKGTGATPFDAALDLKIDTPGRIQVQGRGLDVNLGGSLVVTGSLAQPKPVGAFHLIQGRLQLLTTDLDFSRANLTFAGDLSPQLDFLATTQAGNALVGVAITGDPSDPKFTFTSTPSMPQDEILSRLLFGAPAGQLSPTQALVLAEAATIYSGGNSALEGLRRSLGLGAGAPNNPLSRFLGDRISIGMRTGATPAQTGIGISARIYKQLKAKASINAQGAASVGAGADYEW